MSFVVDFVEDVGSAVGDVIETVGGAVVDVVDFVVEDIIEPVVDTVGNVIQAALDDPIKTIAQIAAIATQQYWALPLIEGADVAIAGGDLGDVLEATAKAAVMQAVGSYVGNAVGSYVGEMAAASEYGASTVGSATALSQAKLLALQEAGMATSSALAAQIAGSAAGAAAVAVVSGQDPLKAALTGGVGAAVPAVLGQVSGFKQLPNAAQKIIESAVFTELSGGDVSAGVINAAIAATGLTTDIIKQLDPDGKLSRTQVAILSDVLMGTASAALTGGDPSSAVRAAMLSAGSKALGDVITGAFKDSTSSTDAAMAAYKEKVAALEANQEEQKTAAADYNNMAAQLNVRIEEQKRLAEAAQSAIDAYNGNKTQANYDAAMAAKRAADEYTTSLNKDYAEFFRPKLQEYNTKLANLQAKHDEFVLGYTKASEEVKTSVDKLTQALDPIYFNSNRAFVEAMNPEFNADEYIKVNGLKPGEDAYEHFLNVGQFRGLPTNAEEAQALAKPDAQGVVDKPKAAPAANDVFDGSKFSTTAAAQKAAAAAGKEFFTDKSGNTYQILTDSAVKDKIKSATSFGEAFAMARKAYGSDGTFEWTNPDTGKTTSFSTQTKTEAAAASNAGSLVKVDSAVTDYVSNKILGNISDFKNFNPADLSKQEYAAFINSYLNASNAQRQQMLKGADGMTYNVIANVLKDAPQMIQQGANAPTAIQASGELKASDYTNYLQVVKTGLNTAASDIASLGVRGLQVLGQAIGADTPTLSAAQELLTSGRDREMSKLVGNERVVAAGLAAGIESAASWMIGGPATSIASLGAIAANNSWIEGTNAVIDSRGYAYANEAEAKANGVFTYRKLTTQENALRTALMASLEVAGEAVGVPGMSKLMKGLPIGGSAGDIATAVKNYALGTGNEVLSEIATTTAQMAVDKIASFGLGQNATWADYAKALQDTTLSTIVAVGTSGSMATVRNNLNTAAGIIQERADAASNVLPLTYNSVVAKDATGKDVTFAELLTAQNVANFSDLATANAFKELTPTVDLNAYVSLGDNVKTTLGDLFAEAKTVANESFLSEAAVAEIMRQQDFKPVNVDLSQFVGKPATATTFSTINTFIDENKLDAQEAIEIAKKEGVTLTEAQAQQYVQQGKETELSAALAKQLDPTSTTFEEAKQFFTAKGYTPTDEEVRQFVAASAETAQQEAIAGYVNPRQVTFEEAKNYLISQGYTNPTNEEVQQFVGQVNEAQQATKIAEYADPRVVDVDEVRNAYAALGLKKPTQEDVQKLVGVYAEKDLAGKAKENLDPARYNAIMAQLDELSVGASKETLDAIALVKSDLNAQITALGGDIQKLAEGVTQQIGGVQTQIGNVQTALEAAIADAKAAGLQGDQALQAAIDKVAGDLGTTKADLLSQMGTTEAQLRSDFATQIGQVQTQLGNVQGALETAIADAKAAGLKGDEALQAAIDAVAGDLGTTKADLLAQIGTTEAALKTEFATQLGTVQTQISDVQSAILDKVAAYEQAGVARDDALSLAITSVATDLGTTKTDLLTQLGTTEAALQQQLSGISADVQAKYDALTAEQKALADQLRQQGVDLNTAINTATAQISTDVQAKYDALSAEQKALATQLQQQGIDLNTAIQQAQQQTQGQIGQLAQDVQTKYDTLTQSQQQLAQQLAQQGFDLNTAIELVRTQTGAGFEDIRTTLAQNQQATQQAILAEAERTRQAQAEEAERTRRAQAASALQTQRMGNLNTMLGMLSQAPDLGGQQVSVKAPDPAKIGYIYDWSSIFANPSQEKMFASPYGSYAQGGAVRNELDEVNDELLKILRG